MLSGGPRRGVFSSPAFARYFLGQALSYVGDGLRLLAVPLLVFHLTKSALSTGGSLVAEVERFPSSPWWVARSPTGSIGGG